MLRGVCRVSTVAKMSLRAKISSKICVDHDLTGWRTIDSAGNLTQVELHNVVTGKKLNPRLFIVRDFDDE